MKIEVGKSYKLRNGKNVVITSEIPDAFMKMVGYIENPNAMVQSRGQPTSWSEEGKFCHTIDHDLDIVEEIDGQHNEAKRDTQ